MSPQTATVDRVRAWAHRTGVRGIEFYVEVLVGHERTVWLERFLGFMSALCGLWIIAWWQSFGEDTMLAHVPEGITGGLLFAAGIWRMRALRQEPVDLKVAILTAKFGTALWSAITISFLLTPPRTTLIIPITAAIATANFLITIRFALLYPTGRAVRKGGHG